MISALRVTARLASPLAGDPPMLDGLLTFVASRLAGKGGVAAGYKVDRRAPCPDAGGVPIYVVREAVGRHLIARCSAPVLAEPAADYVEHVAKRVGVEHAGLLAAENRKVVATTNGENKSYRLPLRVRRVDRVAWLCVGRRREVLKLLKCVPAVGKKPADGYGRVAGWEVESLGEPPHPHWPWWCESEAGPVLMRPLPADWPGLPPGLIGFRRWYGSVTAPYFHPDTCADTVEPC